MSLKKESSAPPNGSSPSTQSRRPPSNDEELLDAVGRLALYEILARLEQGDTKGIPPTALFQLGTAWTKLMEKRPPDKADEGPETDVLDLIESADLSPARKKTLVKKEIDRAKGRLKRLESAYEQLLLH